MKKSHFPLKFLYPHPSGFLADFFKKSFSTPLSNFMEISRPHPPLKKEGWGRKLKCCYISFAKWTH